MAPSDDSPIAPMIGDALKLHRAGRFKEAQALCHRVLALDPGHFDALQIAGGLALQCGDPAAALDLLTRAIGINPNHAASHYNHGNALMALERYAEAITSYDDALRIKPRYASAHNNRGAALQKMGQLAPAAQSFEAAFTLRPDDADAYNNHGMTLMALGRGDDALKSFDAAIAIRPDFATAHGNRGNALLGAKQFSAALESYDRALALDPGLDLFHGLRLHAQMCLCDWAHLDSRIADIRRLIDTGKSPSTPLSIFAVLDSPALHRSMTAQYVQRRYPARDDLGPIPKSRRGGKIRIGYYSADYHNHPVPHLMAEVFESHDRAAFEIIAFSFGPDRKDDLRKRLRTAFGSFIDVRTAGDGEIAALSREIAVDIAVDLNGYTTNCRPGIFAHRAAPVQVNYLGYPGTMGTPYMDYLIADRTLIPENAQGFYSEKIAYLPRCYQPGDRKRSVGALRKRADYGLPEDAVVFCGFHSAFKITPRIFDCWMNMLKATAGSVLWLRSERGETEVHLRAEAQRRGVAPERLVFAAHVPIDEHLARHQLADLFVDTFPYNAHSTTNDALWMGLPALTLAGESYASRVAASLLKTAGLPTLITTSPEAYEARGIELANDREKRDALRAILSQTRFATPLFDTPAFTQGLEAAYTRMMNRYDSGLPPAHFYVED